MYVRVCVRCALHVHRTVALILLERQPRVNVFQIREHGVYLIDGGNGRERISTCASEGSKRKVDQLDEIMV